MFVRTKTTEGRTYLQVVKSYWRDEKPRQRVIATLGKLDKLRESGQIDGALHSLARFSEKVRVTEEYGRGSSAPKRWPKQGPSSSVRVFGKAGIGEVLSQLLAGRNSSSHLERAAYLAPLSRLFFPGPDRFSDRQARDFRMSWAWDLSLHHLYRAMAFLGDNREWVEEGLFFRNRHLFSSDNVP